MMMRVLPVVIAMGVGAATMAVSVNGQTPDNVLRPASIALVRQGEEALASGQFDRADDLLESALVADPRNRGAFIALARVATRQKLYGQAIRLTNKALLLEPNDLAALGVQGEAMVEMGAVSRAHQNLARLKTLCGTKPCAPAVTLAAAIARGPSVAQTAPSASAPKKN
jgi:Tfp pilus assembly protein PilF